MLSRQALEDILIIDFTTVWAGPFTTRLLADFGATVIKVESIQHPDPMRFAHQPLGQPSEKPYNRGGYFHQFHYNKYGITLDISRSKGREILMQLVKKCDVFVSNYSPRALKNLGLTYEELSKVNPSVIVSLISGYGNTGPYRDMPALGSCIEAITGFRGFIGYGDGIPITPGTTTADPVASLHSAFAILAAIVERRKTGKGRSIDVSICESFACILEESILEFTVMQKEPHQLAAGHSYYAPYGFYRSKGDDSWIAISVTSDKEWAALVRIIGNSALTAEKYSDSISRWQNRQELDRVIEAWTSDKDAHEAMQLLQQAGVSAGACNNSSDVLNEVHLKARDFFWSVTSPDTGTYPLAGPVIKLSETPATLRLSPPALGEHNEYVLSDLLGFSVEEIDTLKRERIIGNEPAY